MFTFISALNIFVDCERQFICLIVFFLYTQMWWQNSFCVFLLSKTQTAF